MAVMSLENPTLANKQRQEVVETTLLDKVIPKSLQEAETLTCKIIGDVIQNDAPPPDGIELLTPNVPQHVFDRKEEGITISNFRLEKVRAENSSDSIPHTYIDVDLVHNSNNPHFVELSTSVKIEQTETYDLGKYTTEISKIIITPPVRLPEEEDKPVFDMRVVALGVEAQKEFRDELAQDINESYIYIADDKKFAEGKRKIRIQGKLIKSPTA